MIKSGLSLDSQKENLAYALAKNDVAFLRHGNAIVIRFSMELPQYETTLKRINATMEELWNSGKMAKGEINYTRGADLDENLKPLEKREMIVFHFGTQEEFDRLREGTYPKEWFIGHLNTSVEGK